MAARGESRKQIALGGMEATPGYALNGESEFTRMAARAARHRMQGEPRFMTTRQRIEQQERRLRGLRADLQSAGNVEQRQQIRRNISAKEKFLERLWAELAGRT